MSNSKINVGVIGCGNISDIYLETGQKFELLNIAACAALAPERARKQAAKYGIPKALTVAEILADPDIQIILNLTTPSAHFEVGMAAIEAGKSVYNEKPLTIELDDARRMLAAAKAKNVLVGGAPDTFLGAGLQTCRKLIDDGAIGTTVAATAFMLCHGHESWHPAPEFYYKKGGGPLFDMGPYYLTALVTLMGPIRRVTGSTRITFPVRTITSEPLNGQQITVDTPTHIAGVLDFANGAIGTIITSFDVWDSQTPLIEIYGSEGSLSIPDPNTFGGPVRVKRHDDLNWVDIPLTHGYAENSRSVGVADMAYALRSGRPHRASGELTFHILEIMHAIHEASKSGKHIELTSTCGQPAPLPTNLPAFTLDE